MSTVADATTEDPLIGNLIGGRYRVLRKLGEGGAGVVYDAVHEELGRPVAIKVLGAAWAYDQAAVERFQREARAASGLGHRHIVDVYDLGKLDDGRPYLVMERLHGEPVDVLLERGEGLAPEQIALIVEQAASALDAVHKKGIVHRDIKPENLFLALPDEESEPEVKLLDFGLVAVASPDARASRLTRQGTVHGTPHYMAPEATGDELPDHRADIYSLGVVAYELITGKVPFDSPNPLRILTLKHERDAPSLAEATSKVFPEELEEVFRRALSRHPDMRYDTAGELARALRAALPGAPVSARAMVGPPAAQERKETRSRITAVTALPTMRRAPLILGALGAAVAVAGVIALVGAMGPEEEPVAIALDEPAASEAATAETRTEEPQPAVEEQAPAAEDEAVRDEAQPAAEDEAQPLGEEGARAAVEAPREEPRAARAGAAREPGSTGDGTRVVNFRGRVEPAAASEPASDARDPALAETHRERAIALTREGTTAMLQGRIPEAIRLFRDATIANPRYAAAWRQLGLANERLGRGPEAVRAYERYLTLAPSAPDADVVRSRLDSLR